MDLAVRHSGAGQPSVRSSTHIVSKGIVPRELINNKKACQARNSVTPKISMQNNKNVFLLDCFRSKSDPEQSQNKDELFSLLGHFSSPRVLR